jgi:hypothetical protein
MGNPHGSVSIQLGKNQTQAALTVMSRGIDDVQAGLEDGIFNDEDVPARNDEVSQGLTVYGKILQAAKDKGWVNQEGTWVAT